MYTDLNDYRSIDILVDENNNIAVFPKSKNPDYDGDDWTPTYLPSKTPYELKFPLVISDGYYILATVLKTPIQKQAKSVNWLAPPLNYGAHLELSDGFLVKACYVGDIAHGQAFR
jgi:hypothetical protein